MQSKRQEKDRNKRYSALVLSAIRVCKMYKPKFGHGKSLSLSEFQGLYRSDHFYSWFGLDSPLLYAAHKAAGGMTSVYRQIGLGCQRLFQQIIVDSLGLTSSESTWSYKITKNSGKPQTLSLDGRIVLDSVKHERKEIVIRWLNEASSKVGVSPEIKKALRGAVFEVRQGYKSKDSKRQNADIANAAAAYSAGYLPVLLLLSAQIDDDVAERYKNSRWLILRGELSGTDTTSTYVFCRDVLGYDLAVFFKRNSRIFKQEIETVLADLLR